FNDELDLDGIKRLSRGSTTPRTFVEQFEMHDGRKVCILADGRLINLAAGEGHPAAVMDMSFANQAMAAAHLAKNYKNLEKQVYDVPLEIDEEVAALKLASMGIDIDVLTPEQVKYMASWSEGT
ncbi:MAG TPA: adenosylhomocysteinase, partial [Candidatus Tumulicola sp.]